MQGSGNQRTEELNDRMYTRNIPTGSLQTQYGIRPVSTKYAMMPILDRRAIPTVPLKQTPVYNTQTTFNPGNAAGPWSGFASCINDESTLRNQFFALQRGAGQACYIPPKNSDMYEAHVPITNRVVQPFPDLFEKQVFEKFNPSHENMGSEFFNNHSRCQLKDIK